MLIRLKTGRICKSSRHRIKVELPRLFSKYQNKAISYEVIGKWNDLKMMETPLMAMIRMSKTKENDENKHNNDNNSSNSGGSRILKYWE